MSCLFKYTNDIFLFSFMKTNAMDYITVMCMFKVIFGVEKFFHIKKCYKNKVL